MPRALRVLHQCQVTMRHPSLGFLASVADILPLDWLQVQAALDWVLGEGPQEAPPLPSSWVVLSPCSDPRGDDVTAVSPCTRAFQGPDRALAAGGNSHAGQDSNPAACSVCGLLGMEALRPHTSCTSCHEGNGQE